MNGIAFAHPNLLYLLLVIPLLVSWYIFRQRDPDASIQLSTLKGFSGLPASPRVYLRHVPFTLRMIAIAFLVIVLARPQSLNTWKNVETEGIDIIVTLDISTSMLARDFIPDRIEAAKDIGIQFVSGRKSDRIGLVVFAGESFTLCPLTTDHVSVVNLFKDVKTGLIEDGTAIGSGLATAVSRLKDSDAISRVIILLTDGVNNKGEIAPLTAAEIAKTYGVRVYTVGVGTQGEAPYPMQTPFGVRYQNMKVEIDESLLTQIAEMTGGKYFRAEDNKALTKVYDEIDKMERIKIEVTEHSKKQEEYRRFAFIALALLAIDVLLRSTILRSIP
jgi:Ca-activated chloride channel family protein